VRSSAAAHAFATLAREQFVEPGSRRIKSPIDLAQYRTTDDDIESLYHNVLIVADESRGLNNSRAFAPICSTIATVPGDRYSTSAAAPVTTPPLLPSWLARPDGSP
jgi:hypothetical protein